MIDFWLNMDSAMKTFVAIGAVSSLVLTIQMVLALMGGAMEGVEADFEIGDGGEGGATGILSIRSIGAFYGFGWTGVTIQMDKYRYRNICCNHCGGYIPWTCCLSDELPTQLAGGRYLKLQELYRRSRYSLSSIPPNRKGMGQMEVMVQGRLRIVKCVTDHDKKIQNQSAVRVQNLLTNKHFWYPSRKRINPNAKSLNT